MRAAGPERGAVRPLRTPGESVHGQAVRLDRADYAQADHETVAEVAPEPGSYRDRNGAIWYRGHEVFRGISSKALADWEALSKAPFFAALTQAGALVATERVEGMAEAASGWAAVLRHERIPFISYPYEWAFGMLRDAALLHLDLMLQALDAGMILKDASAYNIQWRGAEPVFIDIPSFERLEEGAPWVGYRQFCELFLYPLMLQAYKGIDFRPWLRGALDGIPADAIRPLITGRDYLRPGVLMHVVAQNALQRRYSAAAVSVKRSLAAAGFDKALIVRNVERLRNIVEGMTAAGHKTSWADYDRTHSYDAEEFEAKRAFVAEAVARQRWPLIWDLGCNTGTFSRIAAQYADLVVAMDGDRMAIEQLYQAQKARPDRRSILPLVINLADPSPAQGWRGLERKPLPERGRPQLTLCLALIHHIVIGSNIPMAEFIAWLAALGTSLVIEFVGRDDEMVGTLLANKDDQYGDYRQDVFEALLARHFDIAASRPLKDGKRMVYLALARN
jgi:hypothetical protein